MDKFLHFTFGAIIGTLIGFLVATSMGAYICTEGVLFKGLYYRDGKWQADFEMKMKDGWNNEILHK